MPIESVLRIDPAVLEEPTAAIADVLAELSSAAATLGRALHPRTAGSLAGVVRIMNTYYSNLIEGHDTRPRDIERALAGELDQDEGRRNLQLEAAAHVHVQAEIDRLAEEGTAGIARVSAMAAPRILSRRAGRYADHQRRGPAIPHGAGRMA